MRKNEKKITEKEFDLINLGGIKSEKPDCMLVSLYDTPDSPAYAKYYAVLLSGNDLYGKVVFLKEKEIIDASLCITPLNEPTTLVEWEWLPQSISEEEEKMVIKLYKEYIKEKGKKIETTI